jgi:hypothetical protein
MMEVSGSVQLTMDPDPVGPKTYGSCGSGSATLVTTESKPIANGWEEEVGGETGARKRFLCTGDPYYVLYTALLIS